MFATEIEPYLEKFLSEKEQTKKNRDLSPD